MNKLNLLYSFLGFSLIFFSCKVETLDTSTQTTIKPTDSPKPASSLTLVTPAIMPRFTTDFENCRITADPNASAAKIQETERIENINEGSATANNSWKTLIYGRSTSSKLQYEAGTFDKRQAFISTEGTNNVLDFKIAEARTPLAYADVVPFKQKVQFELYNYKIDKNTSTTNPKEYYQRVDFRLDPASFNKLLADKSKLTNAPKDGDWMTIWESFNAPASTANIKSHRVSVNLVKSNDMSNFEIKFQGQASTTTDWDDSDSESWSIKQSQASGSLFAIIPNKWYTMEVYMKEGTKSSGGRAWLKITDKDASTNPKPSMEFGDFRIAGTPLSTQNARDIESGTLTSDGFKYICAMKLYTSGKLIKAVNPSYLMSETPLKVSFDNYSMYDAFPYVR